MPTVELRTTAVAAGGDAVARDGDGKVTFVTGAMPGERVVAELTDERHDFNRAVAVEILDGAPGRVAPPCPHVARGCGGCGWQHIELSAQRALKIQIVADALRRIGGIAEPDVRHGPHLPAEGFRTSIRLARASHEGARNGIGFRHARSHDVVDIDSCLVAHPLLVDLMGKVDMTHATEVTLRCGARTGDLLALGDGPITAPAGVRIGPKAWLTEEVAGMRWRISAKSFFQARPDGADALVALVRRASEGASPGPMIDAYGGVGLFAGTVGFDRDVTILEWSTSSARDARENVPSAKVVATDVSKWRPSRAGLVIADPPRTGLGKGGVAPLVATGASHLVLISCDPASLARDAKLLGAAGFRHGGTALVDLFPHTPHIEAVTRFIRR